VSSVIKDGRLGRDHLDLRVGLHDLLDARQGQLVQLVVVLVRLELGDLLLPVRVEDVAVVASQALVDLRRVSAPCLSLQRSRRTFCHEPVKSCGSGAWFWAAIWTNISESYRARVRRDVRLRMRLGPC
jgi:hypothetical protein